MTSNVAWSDLALFYLIAIIPLSLLWTMGLKDLSRDLAISIARMSIQLLVIGFYLQTVFDLDNLALNLLWLVAMATIAAITSAGRAQMPRLKSTAPLTAAILIAMLPVLLMFIVILSRPVPWYSAQVTIPIAGMLLGNALGSLVIALRRFNLRTPEDKEHIELLTTMGATKLEARRTLVKSSLRAAASPRYRQHGNTRAGLSSGNDDRSDSRRLQPDRGGPVPDRHHARHLRHPNPRHHPRPPLHHLHGAGVRVIREQRVLHQQFLVISDFAGT